ncbi:MAG: PilT/PilU family type 4a pilus ATPase [Gammaproteobacteria bacterium]|nr:PilT/PilU family type 4a pilus ATPase [Gammaproteobacteria bacterium]
MDIAPYLNLMTEKKGTELLLGTGSPPRLKLSGKHVPVGKVALTAETVKMVAAQIMGKAQLKEFQEKKTSKFSYGMPNGNGQFNAEVLLGQQGIDIIFRPAAAKPKAAAAAAPASDDKEGLIDSMDLLDYLRIVIARDASDIFLTSGSQIKVKISGRAVPLSTFTATPEITKACAYSIMTDEQIDEFESTRDLDFAIAMPDGSARFRANAFFQRRSVGLVMRLIPSKIPTVDDLNLPPALPTLIMAKRGLLLMVGGTGSGKSTTLAAMINHRNANSAGHILTIEDPVEFSHPNQMSIVNQREVGVDTKSYATAIKASLREAPDVILIGEIRTAETMEAALELSNTGHLAIATLHANNANQAMDRCINMFPTEKHKQLFMDMSQNISAVISQRLIPDVRGKRCAAIEIMINTPFISELILKGALSEIKEAMQVSGAGGMKTFDAALEDLYRAGKITLEEALKNADSPNDLEGKITFG